MNATAHSLMHRALSHAAAGLVAALLIGTPVQAQNVCDSKASLINPAAAQSGIGGTGAPALVALRAWWHALLGGAPKGGSAGQDVIAGRPGIGGTGIGKDGTGGIGGTGIVGVITGFASICVNGVEVHYDASTPVTADGRTAMARELAVGQVVAVRASGSGAQVAARNIAVIHAAVGPVSGVDTATGRLELLGQTVRADDPGDLSTLKTGDWVQVSGHRLSSGEVAASRIEPVVPQAQAQITGPISQLEAGGFTMYGAQIRLDNPSLPGGAVPGTEVSVRGRWDGSSLHAQALEVEPTRQGVGRVDSVVLEGYVHGLRGRELTLSSSVVTLAPDVQITGDSSSGGTLAVNQRVQVSGRVGADQSITVDRVDVRGEASGRGGGRAGKSSSSSGKGSSGKGSGGKGSSGSKDDSGSSGSQRGSGHGGSSGSDSGSSGSSGSGSSGGGGSGSGGSGGGGGGSDGGGGRGK